MKRVALYARTSLGADRGQNPETQLVALRASADRLGVEVVSEYVDQASGTRADRAGLRTLLEAAHRREFDGLLIWALDRLSREGIGAMVAYLEKFKTAGVVVKSHQDRIRMVASRVGGLTRCDAGHRRHSTAQRRRRRICRLQSCDRSAPWR
jgi:DNA invertase Pin-like site-specific DNA recombinase